MEVRREKWEESYARVENNILYPKEECVKFLNRFVRRKLSKNEYVEVLLHEDGRVLKALEYGCGVGATTALLHDFGVAAVGVDVSSTAIEKAKQNHGEISDCFSVVDGTKIPFQDKHFDFSISDCVLDSMSFELAGRILLELDRVTKNLLFVSLISGDDSSHFREYCGEEIVETEHEKGTIQTYYNWSKILEIIRPTGFRIVWAELHLMESCLASHKTGRYYLVLDNS